MHFPQAFRKVCYILALPVLSFLVTSCSPKSRTKTSAENKESKKALEKKYAFYSEKLGITVDEESNLELIAAVHNWLGVPYKDNACSKEGTDCSGFVNAVYAEVYHKKISRNTQTLHSEVKPIEKRELREGDLVFFNISSKTKATHVGIYLREGKFAHASVKKGVMLSSLDEPYYQKYYLSAGRLL